MLATYSCRDDVHIVLTWVAELAEATCGGNCHGSAVTPHGIWGRFMARPYKYFFQQIDFVGFLYHFFYYFCSVKHPKP